MSQIDSGIRKAKSIPQDTLQQNTGLKTDDCITFVQMHNPNNPPVWGKVKDILELLENCNRKKTNSQG